MTTMEKVNTSDKMIMMVMMKMIMMTTMMPMMMMVMMMMMMMMMIRLDYLNGNLQGNAVVWVI